MKRRRCSAIFVGNLRRQTPLHRQKGVQILEPQLCKDIKTVKNMRMLLMNKRSYERYVQQHTALCFYQKKNSLDANNLTFLVCITFVVLQGSGKKKGFC